VPSLEFLLLAGLMSPGLAIAALIVGTPQPDVLPGTPGPDTIDGKGGADTMMGLGGNDTYIVDNVDDVVLESAGDGNDTIRSTVSYTLPIFVENLILLGTGPISGTGNNLNNRLTGNGAKNVLDGRGGADRMTGLAGDDTYIVDNAGDVVVEAPGGGTDTVRSSTTYQLSNNVEVLVLTGTAAINGVGNSIDNTMTGNANNNVLTGAGGNDTLNGAAGNDRLIGGPSNDVLTGGAGQDTFQFDAPLSASTNVDRITDFNPLQDSCRLDGAVFTAFATSGPLGVGAFALGAVARDTTDRILYDQATGALRYDPDGTGPSAAVRFAMLSPGLAVTSADFVVVNPVAVPVNFTTQIQPIFGTSISGNCTDCHKGPGAPRGLHLDPANSYANIVNVASSEVPSLKRVKPGDDSNSYLVQKIEGTAAVGGRMPLGKAPLTAADISLIRRWIVEGARH
jgi:Ca2+-binding RTX toxin-like protein